MLLLSKLPVFQAVNTWCPNFRTLTFNGKEGRDDFRKHFFNGKEGRVGFRKDNFFNAKEGRDDFRNNKKQL